VADAARLTVSAPAPPLEAAVSRAERGAAVRQPVAAGLGHRLCELRIHAEPARLPAAGLAAKVDRPADPPRSATSAAVAARPVQPAGAIQLWKWRDLVPSRATALAGGVGLAVGGGGALLAGAGVGLLTGGVGLVAGGLAAGGTALYRHATRHRRDRSTHQALARRLETLEAYEHIGAEGAEGRLSAQYRHLDTIEQGAHAWMRDSSHRASDENRQAMFGVLGRIDAQRRRLVGHTLAGDHRLWLPERVDRGEAERARGLFESIRQGTGNVKIQDVDDGGGFRANVLTDISKLLQSQHGRDMLAELDANQGGDADREVRIGTDWSGSYSEDKPGNWARAIGEGTKSGFSPEHGRTGTGAGSHVQIAYAAPTEPDAGTDEEPLHSPSYITLGHELGHARRTLAGRGREDVTWDRPTDPRHRNLETQAVEQELWNKPEEFENITQQENPLRRQLGLPERRYHRSHPAVSKTRKRQQLERRYRAALSRIDANVAYDLPEHGDAYRWAYNYLSPEEGWGREDAIARAEESVALFERQVATARRR
jgi:hypothetical protein